MKFFKKSFFTHPNPSLREGINVKGAAHLSPKETFTMPSRQTLSRERSEPVEWAVFREGRCFLTCSLFFACSLFAQETSPLGAVIPPPSAEAPSAAVVAAPAGPTSAPSVPPDTLAVVRLKGVEALDKALDALKDWVRVHPSVQSLFDEEWEAVDKFDLRRAAADYLDLSAEDFNKFFNGAITLYISGDFAAAKKTKSLPVALEITTRSSDSAKDFAELLKSEDDVQETEEVAEGVERIRITSHASDIDD